MNITCIKKNIIVACIFFIFFEAVGVAQYKLPIHYFNVKDFGAKGDAITDDSKSIRECLKKSKGETVYFPEGVYNADSLYVYDSTVLVSNGAVVKSNKINSNPIFILAKNVKITGFIIDGNKERRLGGVGILALQSPFVDIERNSVINTYDQAIQIDHSDYFTISNNIISNTGGKNSKQFQGINIIFSSYGTISNNTVSNTQHGIQYWGNDDNNSSVYVNEIKINNNTVSNSLGGGIWGSRGENIQIDNNTVNNSSDVGIDFEKSINCQASFNTVSNCKNGCLAIFYASDNISFGNNKIIQDTLNKPGVAIYGNGISKGILIQNNLINCKMSASIITQPSVAKNINIIGNTLIGYLSILDCDSVFINGNVINSNSSGGGIDFEGGSNSIISNNQIIGNAFLSSLVGIKLYWRSKTFPCQHNIISANYVNGFPKSIVEDNWGDHSSYNYIIKNRIESIYHHGLSDYRGSILENVNVHDITSHIVDIVY